jgi:polyamine oxidase
MQNVALGNGFKVELGPNWIQGLGEGAKQNPIFTLAIEDDPKNIFSDASNLTTFNHDGPVDMSDELNAFSNAWTSYLAIAGVFKIDFPLPVLPIILSQENGYPSR